MPTDQAEPHPITPRNVRLLSVKAEPYADASTIPPVLQANIKVQLGSGTLPDNTPVVLLSVQLERQPAAPQSFPWNIAATFLMDLASGSPISQEVASTYGSQNGVRIMWPFAREYLADLTRRLGALQPVLLPALVVDPSDDVNHPSPEAHPH